MTLSFVLLFQGKLGRSVIATNAAVDIATTPSSLCVPVPEMITAFIAIPLFKVVEAATY